MTYEIWTVAPGNRRLALATADRGEGEEMTFNIIKIYSPSDRQHVATTNSREKACALWSALDAIEDRPYDVMFEEVP